MRYVSNFIALSAFMLATACTDPAGTSQPDSTPEPGVSERTCERLDSCNDLIGSVEECIEKVDRELDGLTKSERADTELALNGCLALQQCDAFIACIIE
jgi:hypothetical protein